MADKDEPQTALEFFINTAPEMDALERAAADGKHGRFYTRDEQLGAMQHSVPGASHLVQFELTPAEALAGLTSDALDQLARAQDADAALAFLYIARILAPPMAPLTIDSGRGVIDFDDVLSKIGWDPRSTAERREMHRKIYQFIVFGERAQVIGRRRGAYKDKHTGELIDTEVSSPLWRIVETERPEQGSLFPATEIPVRVELVISRRWIELLTSPQTAQYLPMGETLGAIPGNKASGAWARVIGLSLASFWRRNPRESVEGVLLPTRRELLERYPPKTGTVQEVFESGNPRWAIDYWCGALAILVERQLLEYSGEATLTSKEIRAKLPRQGWQNIWLDEKISLTPGAGMKDAITERMKALMPVSPIRRRGRPRKVVT
ncbi:MAG: hypothetical protein EOP09_00990 [Proteobacteria bacterium]|nr:MAG: hypothetical protein EOP09_00990 [Pseudomonadota bacterium]